MYVQIKVIEKEKMSQIALYFPKEPTTLKNVDDLVNLLSVFLDFREDLLETSVDRVGHDSCQVVHSLTNHRGLDYQR